MAVARFDWWIIGSAAVAWHGAVVADVADIDILIDDRDGDRIAVTLDIELRGGQASEQFRSARFGRGGRLPLPIEVMSDLCLLDCGRWRKVAPKTRVEIRSGLFVPSRHEVISILRQFGRAKDFERASALTAL